MRFAEICKVFIKFTWLDIFTSIEHHNTNTKLSKATNITFTGINRICKKLRSLDLIYTTKYRRERLISYTKRGLILLESLKQLDRNISEDI